MTYLDRRRLQGSPAGHYDSDMLECIGIRETRCILAAAEKFDKTLARYWVRQAHDRTCLFLTRVLMGLEYKRKL